MEEMIYEFQSESKQNSEADCQFNKGSTLKNESILKQNLNDLETIRLQLEDRHYFELDSEDCGPSQFCSPSGFEHNQSINSAIHNSQPINEDQSDYESEIMPRKLNLKIHTNIDDNFEIHSSERSSIIERIHTDIDQNVEDIEKESFQATGETCIIICDENNSSDQLKSTLDCNQNYEIFKLNNQIKGSEEGSEKETVIVHKNMPSSENIYNFNEESKIQEDEMFSSIKSFKRPKSYHEIINDQSSKSCLFRRVECTSSYKRLPKISSIDFDNSEEKELVLNKENEENNLIKNSKPIHHRANKNIYKQPVNQLEFQINESSNDKNNQSSCSNIFKRRKREGVEPKSIINEFNCKSIEDISPVNIIHHQSKSEMIITPKECDVVPQAFKREQTESHKENDNKGHQADYIKIKRENHKLKREIESLQQKHKEEIEFIK